jgi:hypothetical protein
LRQSSSVVENIGIGLWAMRGFYSWMV